MRADPLTVPEIVTPDRRSAIRVGGFGVHRIPQARLRRTVRHGAAILCLGSVLAGAFAGIAAAQTTGAPAEPDALATTPRTFEDQEMVTAVDLMVRVRPGAVGALKQWSRGWSLPTGVEPADVRVEVDGTAVPVVAVEEIVDGRPKASDPWAQVILVDVQGSRTRDLAVALDLLTQQVEDLVELGTTSIFLRREQLELVTAPTRDGEELSRVLSQLALTIEGDDELGDARYGARRELLDQSWEEGAARRRLAKALDLERSRVLRHQDQILALAADSSFAGSPRRVGRRAGALRLMGGGLRP